MFLKRFKKNSEQYIFEKLVNRFDSGLANTKRIRINSLAWILEVLAHQPPPERLLDTMRQSSYTIVPIGYLPGKQWQALPMCEIY